MRKLTALADELPEVRLPPERDWGSKPLPAASSSSEMTEGDDTVSHSDACDRRASPDERSAGPSSLSPSDADPLPPATMADAHSLPCTNDSCQAVQQQWTGNTAATAAAESTTISLAEAGLCCGPAETVMTGSMSETATAQDGIQPAAVNATPGTSSAADEDVSPEDLDAMGGTAATQDVPQGRGSELQQIHCNQLPGLKICICWRSAEATG